MTSQAPFCLGLITGSPIASASRTTRLHGSWRVGRRSEEHTSELQSQSNLVCRLLLKKKNMVLVFITSLHVPQLVRKGAPVICNNAHLLTIIIMTTDSSPMRCWRGMFTFYVMISPHAL